MKRALLAMAATGMALLVGACTDGGGPEVATAAGGGSTPSASPSGAGPDGLAQELRFVACMRDRGITDMPDPVPGDTSGRSAVRYALDVMGKGSDTTFQAALDECVSLLPPPEPAQPPSDDDLAGYRQFAQCMRDNGLPEFPDPQPDGDLGFVIMNPDPDSPVAEVTKVDDHVILNLTRPEVKAAFDTCAGLLPNNDD